MTIPDIALIAVASAALTAAALLVLFYVYSRARRRQLATVRAQRNRWWREARNLRAGRPDTFAAHAARAVAHTQPIPYTLVGPVDRTAYLPAFEGDRLGYDDVRTVARQVTR